MTSNAFEMVSALHGNFSNSGSSNSNQLGVVGASGMAPGMNAGIKRMKRNEGPSNFYREIETNAETLLLAFPQKDKYQLMKLLEDIDNRMELAQEILFAE